MLILDVMPPESLRQVGTGTPTRKYVRELCIGIYYTFFILLYLKPHSDPRARGSYKIGTEILSQTIVWKHTSLLYLHIKV